MSKLEILDDKIIFNGVEYFPKEPGQKTININGFLAPMPIEAPLKYDCKYYTIDFTENSLVFEHTWRNDNHDLFWFKKGLIHLTRDAAIKHAEALLSFTRIDK